MLFCPLNVFEDSLFEGLGNHFQHLSEMGNPEGFISKLLFNLASAGRFYLEMLG